MIADPMSGSGPHGETAEVVMRRAVVLTIDGVDPDAEVPVELSRRVLVDSPTAWAVLTGVTYPTITAPFAHPPPHRRGLRADQWRRRGPGCRTHWTRISADPARHSAQCVPWVEPLLERRQATRWWPLCQRILRT